MCMRVSYKRKKYENKFFASLKSLKKGVGSGFGPISQSMGIRIRTKMSWIPNTGLYTKIHVILLKTNEFFLKIHSLF